MERECVITGYSTRIVEKGNIDKEYSKYFNWEKGRRINLDSKLIQLTVSDAFAASGINLKGSDKSRIGIVMGAAFGSLGSYEEFFNSINNNIQPIAFSNSLASIPASIVSIFYGITGPSITLSENYLGGLDGVMLAMEMVYSGLCDIVIIGAWHISSESSKELVSTQDSGAAVIVMESFKHANKRSANVLSGVKNLRTRMIDYVVLYNSPEAGAKEKSKNLLLSLKLPYSRIEEEIQGVSSLFLIVEGIKKMQGDNGKKNVMISAVSDRIVTIFLDKNNYNGTNT